MEKEVEKKNRIVGVQKEPLERLLVIQRTISEAILDCMKNGKFKMVMEYDPEFPKVIFTMYSSGCEEQPCKKMEF